MTPCAPVRPLSEVLHQHSFELGFQEKCFAPFERHDDRQLSASGCKLSTPFRTPLVKSWP